MFKPIKFKHVSFPTRVLWSKQKSKLRITALGVIIRLVVEGELAVIFGNKVEGGPRLLLRNMVMGELRLICGHLVVGACDCRWTGGNML